MTSWQDMFTAEMARAETMMKAAQLAFENGEHSTIVVAHLRSARRHLNIAADLAKGDIPPPPLPTTVEKGGMP